MKKRNMDMYQTSNEAKLSMFAAEDLVVRIKLHLKQTKNDLKQAKKDLKQAKKNWKETLIGMPRR